MFKESFELTLDYKPGIGSADRVFLAMAAYVSAFEDINFTIGKAIDAQTEFGYELSEVQTGSIKSIQNCVAGVSKIAKALANVPNMIANAMIDVEEISSENDIEKVARNIEDQLKSKNISEFPNQININRLAFARNLKNLTEAANQLVEGETIKLKSPTSNVINLNTKTRFPLTPEEIFSEIKKSARTRETLLIRRPVFIGKSAWDFKSIERKKSFSAPILHSEWLDKYQRRELGHLDPGDALIAVVSYDVTKQKGDSQLLFSNHQIIKIERMVKSKEIQSSFINDVTEDD